MVARCKALVLGTDANNAISISMNTVWKLPHQQPTSSSPIPPLISSQFHQKLPTNIANDNVALVESRSMALCTIARSMTWISTLAVEISREDTK